MGKKVLIIDDSRALRTIVAKAIRPYGVEVLEAENGAVGLEKARTGRPDLIFLDYHMPVMNGLETLENLKADPELKATPVFMLTTEAGQQSVIQLIKLGVKDYILKPFEREDIVNKVSEILQIDLKAVSKNLARKAQPKQESTPVQARPAGYLREHSQVRLLEFPESNDPSRVKFLNALRSDIVNEAKQSGNGSRRLVVKITSTVVTDLQMMQSLITFLDRMQGLQVDVRLVAETEETKEGLQSYAETSRVEVFSNIESAILSFN